MKLPFWKDECIICGKSQIDKASAIILDLNTGAWTHKECEVPKKGLKNDKN